jgi:hypothetical protein
MCPSVTLEPPADTSTASSATLTVDQDEPRSARQHTGVTTDPARQFIELLRAKIPMPPSQN